MQEASRRLALASGFDHIVIDRGRPTDPAQSIYLSNTAILRGKPALTVESGYLAATDEESIARIERAVAGWLRELAMRGDGPPPVAAPVWIDRSEVLTSAATGLFTASVERGHSVAAGTVIGRVTDFHGAVVQEIKAPFAGIVLYVLGTPPISKGEPVAFIGQVQKSEVTPAYVQRSTFATTRSLTAFASATMASNSRVPCSDSSSGSC